MIAFQSSTCVFLLSDCFAQKNHSWPFYYCRLKKRNILIAIMIISSIVDELIYLSSKFLSQSRSFGDLFSMSKFLIFCGRISTYRLIILLSFMPVKELNKVDYQNSRQPAQNLKVIDQFQIKNICLGHGRFSKIFACWDRLQKQVYAVKQYMKNQIEMLITSNEDPGLTRQFFTKQMKNMPEIYNKIRHRNIIRFYSQTQNEQSLHFYFQYCNSNSLQDLLSENRVLSLQKALSLIKKIIGACQWLSSQKIVHRNIKPSSILLNNNEPKLGGLLLSKKLIFGDQINDLPNLTLSEEIYQAPQIRNREIVTLKSDVWSLGVLFLRMLYQKIPLNIKTRNQRNSRRPKIEFPQSPELPKSIKQMIESMLEQDYRYRPSMGLVHDFFKHL